MGSIGNRNKTDEQKEFYKNVLECDLLIIDDLGTETMNSMKFTELYKIINTRLLNQVFSLFLLKGKASPRKAALLHISL